MTRRGRAPWWAAIAVLVLSPALSRAQEQPQGQPAADQFSVGMEYTDAASNECSKNNTSPYAGMNPLQCATASVSADGAGGCSLPNATFLRKVGNVCYFCAPLNPPIKGFVIPMDTLPQVEQLGYSCSVDPSNPGCTSVCTGTPLMPPAGGPGGKGLGFTPDPSLPPPTPSRLSFTPNIPAIVNAMNTCLGKYVPYWKPQTVQPSAIQNALNDYAPASARAVPFARLPGESQVFVEAMAMALETQDARDNQYFKGLKGPALAEAQGYDPTIFVDYMVGWLYSCLHDANLVPKTVTNQVQGDPRAEYAS